MVSAAGRTPATDADPAAEADAELVTAGGRVLNVVGLGSDVVAARIAAYAAVAEIHWPGVHHRTDIAARFL